MKTRAAVLRDAHKPFEVIELDLDGPKENEVLIRYVAAGLCHSDLHLIDGDLVPRFPIVGGHEGAGVIEEVGPGVTKVAPGDHVVCSFIPNCGTCRYCSTGRQNLCDMGATHAFASAEEAAATVAELTWGQLADQALVTVGVVEEDVVTDAFNVIGKGGTVVITGLANPEKLTVHVSGGVMTLFEKTIKGTLFGSANPQYDIVKLLRLYDAGQLKLDELVTTRYTLDQVNEGYQDLRDGKNIRGVITYDS